MTDQELIEAQEQTIRQLLAQLHAKPEASSDMFGTTYKWDTPYFRITKDTIYCYHLVALCLSCYGFNSQPYLETRFSEVFSIRLSDATVYNGSYGSRRLTTCISEKDIFSRLQLRAKKATNKGDTKTYNDLTKVWNALVTNLEKYKNVFFKEENLNC